MFMNRRRDKPVIQLINILERPPSTDRNALNRILRQMNRHLEMLAEIFSKAMQQSAAAGHDKAVFVKVSHQLGRRSFDHRMYCVPDLGDTVMHHRIELFA